MARGAQKLSLHLGMRASSSASTKATFPDRAFIGVTVSKAQPLSDKGSGDQWQKLIEPCNDYGRTPCPNRESPTIDGA
ncbi:hypothetical protein SAMN05216562_1350 [Microbulbifer marinus]|uniref:Uncharacterized protein n=1 Tax=Microbulbifer marinus TaxID=658218 RepID=A0A1H3X7Q2_9GAMM|nr:hypothetical protein SAMN05216562_1350 [Microbulbifer marinus]